MKIDNEFIEKSEESLKNAFNNIKYLMEHPSNKHPNCH